MNMKITAAFSFFGLLAACMVSAADVFTDPVTAKGTPIILEGQVTDRSGSPVPGALVEIWQTDDNGIYNHPRDRKTSGRDQGFQFFGSSRADSNGNYLFRTILPGEYRPRPRHIHLKVRESNGSELLTTHVYFTEDGNIRGTGGSTANLQVPIQNRTVSGNKTELFSVFNITVDTGAAGNLPVTNRQAEGPFYPRADVSQFDNDLAHIDR